MTDYAIKLEGCPARPDRYWHCDHQVSPTPPPYGDYERTDRCCHCGRETTYTVHREPSQAYVYRDSDHGPHVQRPRKTFLYAGG